MLSTQRWQSCTSLLTWHLCCCSPRVSPGSITALYRTQCPGTCVCWVYEGPYRLLLTWGTPSTCKYPLEAAICLHGNPDCWKASYGAAGHYLWTTGIQFGEVISLPGEIPPEIVTHTHSTECTQLFPCVYSLGLFPSSLNETG